MRILKKYLPAIIVMVVLPGLFYYCSSPTEPWVKDPREYTWTVDTIKNPDPTVFQTLMSSIWGSSPSDVYICGHTDTGPNIYHYDGDKWDAIDLSDYGLRKGYRNKIFGFSKNDVWIAGGLGHTGGYKTSELLHFNGDEWESFEFETRSELIDVWGTSLNNLWACGEGGIVFHFDGSIWQIDTIKISVEEGRGYFLKNIIELNGIPYVGGYKNMPLVQYFFKKEINSWITMDSAESDEGVIKWGGALFYLSSEKHFYSTGSGGLFEYIDGNWENIFYLDTGIYGIYELVKNKYLMAEFRGKIYLYENGAFESIYSFDEQIGLKELWGNERECFVVGQIQNSTVILRGK